MFDDIIGEKKRNVFYSCHCPICDNTYRREDYDVLYTIMSEHFVQHELGGHGKIPKNITIMEVSKLDITPKKLPEGIKITYTDTVQEGLEELLKTEIENGK